MERLNDIMMRTAQRHQQMQEQRSSQQEPPPHGQRPKQPLTRRPALPEQTARLGQNHPHTPPQPQSPNQRAQHPAPPGTGNRSEQGGRDYLSPRQGVQQRAYNQAARQDSRERRPAYHQYDQRSSQEPQYEAKVTGDHYETHPTLPPADVQDEWEDDATGMRYGDWENAASNDLESYAPGDAAATFTASQDTQWPSTRTFPFQQTSSSHATRILPAMPAQGPEPRSPLSRTLREVRIVQAQPPAPQAPAQEAQRYHPITQPLSPRATSGMYPHISQDVPHATPQAARPVTRNSTTQAASLPSQGPCPLCKGAGYLRSDVPYGHPNFGKPIACECKEAERAEKRRLQLRSMSNLDAFLDKSFRNFNPRVPGVMEAFKVAQAFADNPDGWLLLIGRNGCGKTHLAAAIANQHLAEGSLVLFATVPDLLDHLRATFAPTSRVVYDQLFSTMREAELLVLDDLGSEQNSPWASEKLFQLLNYRYNSRFPTVITTNNLRLQSVDERIRSRLMDRSLVIELTMDRTQDYRPNNPRRP